MDNTPLSGIEDLLAEIVSVTSSDKTYTIGQLLDKNSTKKFILVFVDTHNGDVTTIGGLVGQRTNLTVNSGKYTMDGEFSRGAVILKAGTNDSNGNFGDISGKINVYNAELMVNNHANVASGNSRAIFTIATETKVDGEKRSK